MRAKFCASRVFIANWNIIKFSPLVCLLRQQNLQLIKPHAKAWVLLKHAISPATNLRNLLNFINRVIVSV